MDQSQELLERFQQSYERVLPEMKALAPAELQHINVDVQGAVVTVLGAVGEIRALRGTAAELPGFDVGTIDRLEDYALALGHAQAMYRAAAGPEDAVAELAAQTLELRDTLFSDASALARRRLLDEGRVEKLRTPSGHKNIAFDLLGLVALMREHWSSIEGKTALQRADLDAAARLADRLMTALGLREQGPVALAVATETRQRAYTLFMRAYDQARRAVGYLRWNEEDADTIAPSLYAGRSNGRRPAEPIGDAPTVPGAPPGPVPPAPPAAPAAPANPGLPGASPFSNG
jgi:hypothetical protein